MPHGVSPVLEGGGVIPVVPAPVVFGSPPAVLGAPACQCVQGVRPRAVCSDPVTPVESDLDVVADRLDALHSFTAEGRRRGEG
jgi:hypothetical protein